MHRRRGIGAVLADKTMHATAFLWRLGLPANFTRENPLVAGAVRFDDQAQFNPCKYLLGLAEAVNSGGGLVFEGTRAGSIEYGEPCRIVTFFAKAYPYAHPMAAARIDPSRAPDGMFISTEQPTHSVRTARWRDQVWLVAVGGPSSPAIPTKPSACSTIWRASCARSSRSI
jgi:hypothetical protein